ncbi:MAG TPA: hypothetical protein VMR52_04750 [Dehalococcoidia bacterium]|nr:hypothetical protein [Dehalococcoidia bacterium]
MTPEDTALHLYQMGRADLAARFNAEHQLVANRFLPGRHQPHPSIWYAGCLLREDASPGAERIIAAALDLQERRQADPHRGNFWWHKEEGVVIDMNACQFVLEALIALPHERLSPAMRERIAEAAALAFAEAERLDVHWTYTNIALLDIHNRILGGELWGRSDVSKQGIARLRDWADRTREVGAPHEFNSATYAAVDLNCLADIASHSSSDEARALALEMEQLVWRHVAKYWHVPTRQLGGPHSRSYRRDVVGAPGFLKVVLYRVLGDEALLAKTPYYDGPDTEGEVIVSEIDYHPPDDALEMLTTPATRDICERVAMEPETEAVARVTPEFSLGTMSRSYGVGSPPEPWPAFDSCIAYWHRDEPPGYGVLYCRYRVNAGPVGQPSRDAVPKWLDIWDEGLFRAAQNGGRAIVAYGIPPRGQRPIDSWRLDIRLLGREAPAVRIGAGAWLGDRTDLAAGDRMIVADGDVYIGIVPLVPTYLGHTPPMTLWRDGDETVLSIVNYEGPPKQFWEYRSLTGPFWKGNVRNGFALWIAPRSEFASADEFRTALTKAPLLDETVDGLRTITFGDLRLEYDLRAMWP